MSDEPRMINGMPVLAEDRLVRVYVKRMQCECGHERWDVLREYSDGMNRLAVALGITFLLMPISVVLFFRNKGIYACRGCGKIKQTDSRARSVAPK